MNNPELTIVKPEMRIGHYDIVEHMIDTNMSEIYHAVNIETDELVALKIPVDDASSGRLRTEIKMHARFSEHPSVVTIDGCGVWRERPFLATREQEGGVLSDDIETNQTSTLESVIEQLHKDVRSADTNAIGSFDRGEIAEIVEVLHQEGLPNLVEDINQIDANEVVEVVAEAANEHGHSIDPESVVAKHAAIELLEKEVLRSGKEEVPDGETILRRANVVRSIAEVAIALHNANIVHRDFKPSNTGINKQGDGRVLDFGIASSHSAEKSGRLFGTSNYMSPEALQGMAIAEADNFALAVTAYTAFTNKLPWTTTPNPIVRFHQLFDEKPADICEQSPNLPGDLGVLVMRGLSLEPSQRPSALEIKDMLAAHC